MRKEQPRRAKGQNLLLLVKTLRAARRAGRLPNLDEATSQFLEERILLTDWYPFELFQRLLVLVHNELYGGVDESARQMGDLACSEMMNGVHRSFLSPGDPLRTLSSFERSWGRYFDFGTLVVEAGATSGGALPSSAAVIISGYEDMSRAHGNVLLGWATASVTMSGGELTDLDLRRAPWLANPVFEVRVGWKLPRIPTR